MTARFAGSRSLDERRRRRLASETEEGFAEFSSSDEASVGDSSRPEPVSADASPETTRFPLRKLVSPKVWKLSGVGLLGLGAGALMLWGEHAAAAESGGAAGVLGPVIRGYGGLLLLLSGQLAMLIWWCRSRSPLDFAGHYRRWMRIAVFLMGLACLPVTGLHTAFAEWVQGQTGFAAVGYPQLIWLVPVVIGSLVAGWLLNRELQENRASLALLWLAAAAGAAFAAGQFELPVPLRPAQLHLAVTGSGLLAAWLVFMSLLLHCRYVVYISPDPPRRKPAAEKKTETPRRRWRMRMPKLTLRRPAFPKISLPKVSLPKLRLPKLSLRRAAKQPDREEQAAVDEAAATQETGDRLASGGRQPTGLPGDRGQGAGSRAGERKQKAKRAAGAEQTGAGVDSGKQRRVDEPIDQEQLKGLSKKQRRKLRKQQRKAQRAAQAGLDDGG